MTAQLQLYWLSINWELSRRVEKFQFNLAWLLPRWLVAMAVVRCVAHATTGKYANTDPTDIRAMTALKRWDSPNV
jgi:hypothetical protein